MINVHNSFSKNCVTALLGVTLAFSPALALAKTTEGATKTNTDIAQVEGSEATATTSGLTDAERAELKALNDKLESFWNKMETTTLEGELTDEEWERMGELEDKARLAEIKDALSADEYAEFEALQKKLEGLGEDEDLTESEWSRLFELEDKAFGYDEYFDAGREEREPMTNEEYVNTLKGLTDAERAELKALRDKSDAYWQAWDRLYETEGLTDAEWDRMNELEQKARLAKLETYLSGDEFAEFKRLYDKLDEELSLTDAEWDRFCAFEDKARLAELEAYLTPEEFAELEGLYEKLDQEGELSDAEWERRNELEAKGPQDDYVF